MDAIERGFRTRHLLIYNFLFWAALTFLELIRVITFTRRFELSWDIEYIIRWPIAPFLTYWILSYFIFHLFLQNRNLRGKQFFLFHLSGSILFAILQNIASPYVALVLERLFLQTETLTGTQIVASFATNWMQLLFDIAVYFVLIAIISAINLYRKYQDQYSRTLELESMLTSSQLQTMKMQLHPHFLFNAFNTISMMVRRDQKNKAVEMISNLGDMLRLSLRQEKEQFVTVEDELTLLDKYLSIEAARYSDRLTIQIEVEEEIKSEVVPYLILQPLVENAFKHGISKNLDSSHLKIHIFGSKEHIHMLVFNSGAGLPPGWEFNKDKGIGLLNTSSRLLKLYQNPVKFLINEVDGGVAVEIVLPKRNV